MIEEVNIADLLRGRRSVTLDLDVLDQEVLYDAFTPKDVEYLARKRILGVEDIEFLKHENMNKEKEKKPHQTVESKDKQSREFDVHHPHDSLFKGAFKREEVALDFLSNRLEPELRNQLALHTLKLENGSFIDSELKKTHSDVVFSVQNDQDTKDYVYFLIEHQTQEDRHMMLRLLEYNVKLMRQHIDRGNKELPCIINFVLYAGKKAYKGPKSVLQAFKDPKLYQTLLAKNTVIELNKESDEQILKDKKAALAEILLKYGRERDYKKGFRKDLLEMIIRSSYYDISFFYIVSQEKHDKNTLLKEIKHLTSQQQTNIMNVLQQMQYDSQQKGILIGEQQGRQQGRQEAFLELMAKGFISQQLADELLQSKS